MKLKKSLIASSALVFSLIPFGAVQAENTTLESVKSMSEIKMDGMADAAWDKAPSMKVKIDKQPYKPSNGYEGITRTIVEMKSLYDDQYIYFLMSYADPTKSLDRFPWMKQADGSWKQLSNKDDTGHDNTYYEDKAAIIWDINTDDFAEKGCNDACHRADDGKVNGFDSKSPARKYTQAGQTLDMWHWKGVRTGVNNQIDDQYIDSTSDPEENANWGRKGDHKTGGGYVNNIDENGQPAFVSANPSENAPSIFDSEKQPFTADYDKTTRIPGIITQPFTGSRADIDAVGVWKEGVWTIEIKRKLVTTGEQAATQDVQFNDLTKVYPFGISVFDNSQINHVYHRGVLDLKFK
ncbi:ethylbenzene dehydrogenase [Psychromonas sp. MB-3u-54]|uniref:ethylbenzene dehydrogenase-related protein n=1 Tax=Psychromonas sp. MB-3u-54 TaxID=2058319 RepID=UPI000C34D171|nr:ethylbenzene dehydrogenase-related protein [Psychromonas sp. MB-3u-54]PKH02809.1 ethylbenzene dehydrogenase [Psychromonas sp. MB-3u-54]